MGNLNDSEFPLISIISVNFNQAEVTCEMLDSLQKITYPNTEIIVVDNGSSNDDLSVIKQRYPQVQLIKSDKNLGFAGGNNLGIRASSGDYVMLLNNDTEVDPGFLEPLVEKFRGQPDVGAVSPKIYFSHTPGMLQFTGFSDINKFTIRNKGWGHSQIDTGQFDIDSLSYFAHGAAMMVPRNVIKEVGMMADIYFLYYEEMDWGQRIRNAGYSIWYVHDSIVYHKESVSTGRVSPLKTYYLNRARMIYTRRNIQGIKLIIALVYQFFLAAPKNMIVFLIKGRVDLFRAYGKAIIWCIKNLLKKQIMINPALDTLNE
jgi:GT2 family glycosyltransferase